MSENSKHFSQVTAASGSIKQADPLSYEMYVLNKTKKQREKLNPRFPGHSAPSIFPYEPRKRKQETLRSTQSMDSTPDSQGCFLPEKMENTLRLLARSFIHFILHVFRARKGRRKDRENTSASEQKLYLEEAALEKSLPEANLRQLVELQTGLGYEEWLASHTIDFFHHVNLVYGSICEHCTLTGCPDMSGPGPRQYQWFDEKGKKVRVPAPQYVDYVMTFTQNTINDETVFPTKFENSFPSSFESIVKKIHRLLFHVLAHVYHSHFKEIVLLNLHAHLNCLFAHFIIFNEKFSLVEEKETSILNDLVVALKLHPCCADGEPKQAAQETLETSELLENKDIISEPMNTEGEGSSSNSLNPTLEPSNIVKVTGSDLPPANVSHLHPASSRYLPPKNVSDPGPENVDILRLDNCRNSLSMNALPPVNMDALQNEARNQIDPGNGHEFKCVNASEFSHQNVIKSSSYVNKLSPGIETFSANIILHRENISDINSSPRKRQDINFENMNEISPGNMLESFPGPINQAETIQPSPPVNMNDLCPGNINEMLSGNISERRSRNLNPNEVINPRDINYCEPMIVDTPVVTTEPVRSTLGLSPNNLGYINHFEKPDKILTDGGFQSVNSITFSSVSNVSDKPPSLE